MFGTGGVWFFPSMISVIRYKTRSFPRTATQSVADNTMTHTTDIEVLDAQDVAAAPLCVGRVPWHLGTSFHGTFTPRTYL